MIYPLSQNDIDDIRARAGFVEKVEIPRVLLEELLRNYRPTQERYAEALSELRRENAKLRAEKKTLETQTNTKEYDS